jgi:hypothetical protein
MTGIILKINAIIINFFNFSSNFSILLKVSFLQFISMQFLKKWFQNFLSTLCCIYIA